MKLILIILLFVLYFFANCTGAKEIVRKLTSWSVQNENGSITLLNTIVPGNIHFDLLKAKKISDPYYRFNELNINWITKETWIYSTSFLVDNPSTNKSKILLLFEGIDTEAIVFLNGYKIGKCNNMFRKYEYDITDKVHDFEFNFLTVKILPSLVKAAQLAKNYPYEIPATVNFNTWTEPSYRQFIRKTASDFGWDFGPALVTCGIWKEVYVKQIVKSEISFVDYNVQQFHYENGSIKLNISVELEIPLMDMKVELSISLDNELIYKKEVIVNNHQPLEITLILNSDEKKKKFLLWYPAGFGNPTLYDLSFYIDKKLKRKGKLGLRKIRLLSSFQHFSFEINNLPIFIKGSNWIPIDPLHRFKSKSSKDLLHLLTSLKAANMNMIRVWGGGVYEDNRFYEYCDENGILVWQEFMFACSMYPRTLEFLESVTFEITFQLKRLSKFTSIILWSANNEIEAMMIPFTNGTATYPSVNRDIQVVDYVKLFVDLIRNLVIEIDKERPFLDTSPSNGILSTNPYVKRWGNPNNISYGDIHFYNYSGDCLDSSMYPLGLFISEFGFQSSCSFFNFKQISTLKDWSRTSQLYEFRQRHENGNTEILTQISRSFKLPNNLEFFNVLETIDLIQQEEDFDNFLFLTQLQQALCYEKAVTTWRKNKNNKNGSTSGILYWQLNDVWQGISWSSIEYGGKWKILHYFVKRFYSPLFLIAELNQTHLKLEFINDLNKKFNGSIQVSLYSTLKGFLMNISSFNFTINPFETKLLSSLLLKSFLPHNFSSSTDFVRLTSCVNSTDYPMFPKELFFVKYKYLDWNFPNISILDLNIASTKYLSSPVLFSLSLHSDQVALFVLLELLDSNLLGYFSENAFLMLPKEEKTIYFICSDFSSCSANISKTQIEKKLKIRCLQTIYSKSIFKLKNIS